MDRDTLILVPTAVEARTLDARGWRYELCGFGVVAAAARTAAVIAARRPQRVMLVGVAGTYRPEVLPVGAAASFAEVAIDGIGAGEGAGLVGPDALGLPQWPANGDRPAVVDRLAVGFGGDGDEREAGALLLTACAAAASAQQARARCRRHPAVLAEDMEGFAVALAARLASVPVAVVRGVSNVAGDRDHRRWRVGEAMAAACDRAAAVLDGTAAP